MGINISKLRPVDRLCWTATGMVNGGRSAWLDRRLGVDPKYGWLFILGPNNSGTTLLSNLLQEHPEIRGLPKEGHHLTKGLPCPFRIDAVRLWSLQLDVFRWTEEDDVWPADRAKFDWARHYPRRSGYLLEKSPPNTIRSRWLQRYFRPAKFVSIVRHPYATCEGIRRRMDCDIETAARHWATCMEILLTDLEKLDQSFFFTYEELTGEPEGTLTRMEKFLNLAQPFDRKLFGEVSAHSIDGSTTGLQNLNAKSIARLSDEDKRAIDALAGPLMERLGYDRQGGGGFR